MYIVYKNGVCAYKATGYLAGYAIVVRDSGQSFFVKDYVLDWHLPKTYSEKKTFGVRKEKRRYRVG